MRFVAAAFAAVATGSQFCSLQNGACLCRTTQANGTACGNMPPTVDVSNSLLATLISSSRSGNRFQKSSLPVNQQSPESSAEKVIFFAESLDNQEVLGFGGAFTDAAAYALGTLPEESQHHILKGYFVGLNYTFGRTHMGSCDFSRRSYSLLPDEHDFELQNFVLRDDRDLNTENVDPEHPDAKLDLMLRAQEIANKTLKFFFAPWSPPTWMKTNRDYVQGKMNLTTNNMETYAKLFSRFVDEYKRRGISFWALSPQNEPDTWMPSWFMHSFESCLWSAEELAVFVGDHLGPLMRKNHPEVKIMAHDGQLTHLSTSADTFIEKAGNYTDGFAWHWYTTLDGNWEDTHGTFSLIGGGHQVQDVYAKYGTSKFYLSTEACTGLHIPFWPKTVGPSIGAWHRGYEYARDLLYSLKNGAQGWVDWNIALTTEGGPNHAKNFADSPVIIDGENEAFYLNPMYYAMGHFSAYIPPGSKRIQMSPAKHVETLGFLRPDGSVTVIILHGRYNMNSNFPHMLRSSRNITIEVMFGTGAAQSVSLTVERDSILSLIIPAPTREKIVHE
eukprot:GEMP01005128.1.p1 GENE.GEMP01005128.1~~GEMP01005128.1.p1  ORF type:complete len:565 (+),score=112.59 GEMP01005128.1:24-1697(+)